MGQKRKRNNMEDEIYDDLEFQFDKFREDVIVLLQCDYDLSLEDSEEVFKRFINEKYDDN